MQSSTRQKIVELLGPEYHTDTMRALGLDPEQITAADTLDACLALYEQAEGSEIRQQIFERALGFALTLRDQVRLARWQGTRGIYHPLTDEQRSVTILRAIETVTTRDELAWLRGQVDMNYSDAAVKRAYLERELELCDKPIADNSDVNLWDMLERASRYKLPDLVEKITGLIDESYVARLRRARTLEACVEVYNNCNVGGLAHVKAHDKIAGMTARLLKKQLTIPELKRLNEELQKIRVDRPRRRFAIRRREHEIFTRLRQLLTEQLERAETPSECMKAYWAAPWNWEWFRRLALEKYELLVAAFLAVAESEGELLFVIEEATSLSGGATHPARLAAIRRLAQCVEGQAA